MPRALSGSACALALLLALPSAGSARPVPTPPQPGFECAVGKPFDDTVWGSATLDAAGKLVAADWTWRMQPRDRRYALSVLSGAIGGNRVEDGTGASAFVSWNDVPDARRRPAKRLVQLTTSTRRQFVWGAFHSGKAERAYNPQVMAVWFDLLAFAQGARAINLNLLDDKGRFVDSDAVDRGLILRADAEIKAMVAALNARIADFESGCTRVDDIVVRDIVV